MKDILNSIIIEPPRSYDFGFLRLFSTVWKYRQLLVFLSWRDILIRYKRTYLGFSWLILRPVFSVLILTFVFNRLANFSSGSVNYVAYVLSGYLFWQFFNTFLSDSGNSLLINSSLITKVYFPRILIPLSYLASNIIDFLASLLLMVIILVVTGTPVSLKLLLLPVSFMWIVIVSIGLTMFYTPLVAKYHDLRYAFPFFMQLLMFASPIGYSQNLIKDGLIYVYFLNPLAGVISFSRWIFFNESMPLIIILSLPVSLFLFFTGLYYFQRQSSNLADNL